MLPSLHEAPVRKKRSILASRAQGWPAHCSCLVVLLVALLSLATCDTPAPLIGFPGMSRDRDVRRGPYIQFPRTNAVTVVWKTQSINEGEVDYGRTLDLGSTSIEQYVGTTHVVTIVGLNPHTSYFYRILAGRRPLSTAASFHTSQRPQDGPFRFAALGDSGVGTEAEYNVGKLLAHSGAALAIHTGDVVYEYGEERNYNREFFHPFGPFLISNAIFPALGNHDVATENGGPYLNNFYLPTNDPAHDKRYYSFDYGNAHFVALDTNEDFSPGSVQYQWLQQDLGATQQFWKFVYFHFPPYTSTVWGSADVRTYLAPLFEKTGVDLVFSGHAHAYERTFPVVNGTPVEAGQEPNYVNPCAPIYVVTGGGGGGLMNVQPRPPEAVAVSAHHITFVDVEANRLDVSAVATHDETIDHFTLTRTNGPSPCSAAAANASGRLARPADSR